MNSGLHLRQCAVLAFICALTACTRIIDDPVYSSYWESQKKFANCQYSTAEQLLASALAELRKRPKDERPSLWSPRLNTHNYSIMTIELLAKCKYAQGKYMDLNPLLAEEELFKTGYTGLSAATPADGAKLYLKGFQAVTKLYEGDFLAAQMLLSQSDDLQRLSDRNSSYVWLGDKGSPELGRYLWLNSTAQILQAQGKATEASLMEPEIKSLRTVLMLKPSPFDLSKANPITLPMFTEHFRSAAENPQAAVINWLAPLEVRYERTDNFASAEAVYKIEISLLENAKDQYKAQDTQLLLANVLDGYAKLLFKMHRDADATVVDKHAEALHQKATTQPVHQNLK